MAHANGSDELVEFYDPTDVFGDLADALAEAFPAVAPELARRPPTGASRDEGADASRADEWPNEAESGDEDAAEDEPTA